MYAYGHYGVALLVYAPVAFALLVADASLLAFAGGVVVLSVATLPDVDMRLPLVPHRGPTHSLLFAALVGAGFGAVGWALGQGAYQPLGDPATAAAFLGAMGALGVCSHLLGDVLTPAGVNVLWPLPGPDVSFYVARADNTLANWGLLGLGVFAAAAALLLAGRVA